MTEDNNEKLEHVMPVKELFHTWYDKVMYSRRYKQAWADIYGPVTSEADSDSVLEHGEKLQYLSFAAGILGGQPEYDAGCIDEKNAVIDIVCAYTDDAEAMKNYLDIVSSECAAAGMWFAKKMMAELKSYEHNAPAK